MKKKKILVLCLAAVLMVMVVTGATLAYLTDNKEATNTFTVGKVKIELIEQQRGEDGLEDFQQNKKLLPIVGSAQEDPKDEYGMPTSKNYVDKMVSIENTGSEDAYVRFYFAIPSALDDGYETFNAGKNVLHFNFGNKVVNGVVTQTCDFEWSWKHDSKWNYYETTIDGIKYNVYYADYYQPLAAGETTVRVVDGLYLDKTFDVKDDGVYAFGAKIELDEGWDWSDVKCPVFALACQAGGFDSVDEAMDAAFGAKYNPWGTETTNWQ